MCPNKFLWQHYREPFRNFLFYDLSHVFVDSAYVIYQYSRPSTVSPQPRQKLTRRHTQLKEHPSIDSPYTRTETPDCCRRPRILSCRVTHFEQFRFARNLSTLSLMLSALRFNPNTRYELLAVSSTTCTTTVFRNPIFVACDGVC